MSEDDETIKKIVRDAVKEAMKDAVDDALTRIGVDVSDPTEMQRDFQHMRDFRESSDALKKKGMMTLVAIFCGGIATALWIGLKEIMKGVPC